ncbi:MAG: hypothetical protein A2114_02740 [Candidatus Vogelbacteria bacterium GWA1_51_14]|uniref:Polysaccharide biosynthesis protein C-terminal domain-containing protein n=1 Tax=Candidatus Vogelbacteria bacterium GWA1_51_14 TaxID=1802435 RepID=A0A1G2Q9L3_9BACT|nr:MAG: hypothetical protein A2114_02740 [Candidatus Vogelbacteria bacterium GWA1_51_14]
MNFREQERLILGRASRLFKVDMGYLFHGGFWITVGQVVSSLSAFLLAIVYANWLSPETYGTYKYVIAVIGILSIPTLSGLGTAVSKAVVAGNEGSFRYAVRVKLKWSLVASAGSIALAGYYLFNANTELALAFLLSAIFIPLLEGFNLYDSFLYGKKLFRTATLYYIIGQITTTALIVVAAYFRPTLAMILIGYLAGWALVRFLLLRRTFNKFRPNNQVDPEVVPYGKHLTAIKAFNVVAGYLDKVLLFQFIGAAPLAIYAITQAPLDQIRSLASRGISILAFPKYAAKEQALLGQHIFYWVSRTALVLALMTVGYIILIPFVFPLFFPAYAKYIWYTQLAALGLIPLASFIPYTALNAQALKKELYYFNFSSAAFQIAALAILTYTSGLVGVIIARILGRFFELLVGLWLVGRNRSLFKPQPTTELEANLQAAEPKED